jgi:hypothetical protein
MSDAVLIISKSSPNLYKFTFSTDNGQLVCEISVAMPKGRTDDRSDEEMKTEALGKLKFLIKSLDLSILNMERLG